MAKKSKGREADIVMYGHTHKPSLHEVDGLMVINPGSISYPRQADRKASYIVMNIEENSKPYFELKYV